MAGGDGGTGPAVVKHIFGPADTLPALSRKYGSSISDIKEWNDIAIGDRLAGRQLIVKQYKGAITAEDEPVSIAFGILRLEQEVLKLEEKCRAAAESTSEPEPEPEGVSGMKSVETAKKSIQKIDFWGV